MTGLSRFRTAGQPPGDRRRRANGRVDRLADVVILEVDGVAGLHHPRYPRELALAYGDGRPGLAWLVTREDRWPARPGSERGEPPLPTGAGLQPDVVVGELVAALAGMRVYAEHPVAVGSWVQRLASHSDIGLACTVRDLRTLVVRPGSKVDLDAMEAVRTASRAAYAQVPVSTAAAADALRHVLFLRLLDGRE